MTLSIDGNTWADYEKPAEGFWVVQNFKLRIISSHLHAAENLVKALSE